MELIFIALAGVAVLFFLYCKSAGYKKIMLYTLGVGTLINITLSSFFLDGPAGNPVVHLSVIFFLTVFLLNLLTTFKELFGRKWKLTSILLGLLIVNGYIALMGLILSSASAM